MGRKRLTYQHVKNVIETEGYGLLSKEYKGINLMVILEQEWLNNKDFHINIIKKFLEVK